jgi:hypothetical protein
MVSASSYLPSHLLQVGALLASRTETPTIVLRSGGADLVGQVLTPEGAGLQGVYLELKESPGSSRNPGEPEPRRTIVVQAYTDAGGEFSFVGLTPRSRLLRVRARGYAPMETRATISAGQSSNVTIHLELAGVISGRVLSAEGFPVHKASVFTGNSQTIIRASVQTDENGLYTLGGLPRAPIHVTAAFPLSDMRIVARRSWYSNSRRPVAVSLHGDPTLGLCERTGSMIERS